MPQAPAPAVSRARAATSKSKAATDAVVAWGVYATGTLSTSNLSTTEATNNADFAAAAAGQGSSISNGCSSPVALAPSA